MTNDFSECNKIQLKYLFQIFEKIVLKFQPVVFSADLHRIFSVFICEQMIQSRREEVFQLIKKYTDPKKNIIQPKDFLTNLLNEMNRRGTITTDLVAGFCRIVEQELANKRNVGALPFKQVAQFFSKGHFDEE